MNDKGGAKMITVQELINALDQIEDKSKTIGIAEWNNELGCYECSHSLALASKEIISENSRWDNCKCDYYIES